MCAFKYTGLKKTQNHKKYKYFSSLLLYIILYYILKNYRNGCEIFTEQIIATYKYYVHTYCSTAIIL